MQNIAGARGLGPGQIHAGADHAAGQSRAGLHLQPHADGAGVPARGRKPVEERVACSLGIYVERLRIILPGKGDDLILRQKMRSGLEKLTGGKVFQIQQFTHRILPRPLYQ